MKVHTNISIFAEHFLKEKKINYKLTPFQKSYLQAKVNPYSKKEFIFHFQRQCGVTLLNIIYEEFLKQSDDTNVN
jgi:hypothetical protein